MDAAGALVRIRAAFPELGERHVRRLGEGWANVCWLGASGLVYRFPTTVAGRTALPMEAALLPCLAPALPLAAPVFRHVAADGSVAAYPLVPGVPLAALAPGHARALAALLTALHGYPRARAAALGLPDVSPAAWRARLGAFWAAALADLAPWWSADDAARAAGHIAGFLGDETGFAFTPALIHGDLVPEHLLAEPDTGRLVGVIDFEDAQIGDPALDFAGLAQLAAPVLAAYRGPADPGLLGRAAFYRSLGPLHEMLYGVRSGRPARVRAGLAAWRRGREGRRGRQGR